MKCEDCKKPITFRQPKTSADKPPPTVWVGGYESRSKYPEIDAIRGIGLALLIAIIVIAIIKRL